VEVGGGDERVQMDAVSHLAGHPQHPGIDGGDVERRVRDIDRSGGPLARQERQVVVVAVERESLLTPERPVGGAHGEDVLPQPRTGGFVGRAVPALDVGLDLGAEAQPEAPSRCLCQLPGHRGGDHRAAGEGERDPGGDVDGLVGQRSGGTGEVRRPPGLGDHHARHPGAAEPGDGAPEPVQLSGAGHDMEFHRSPLRRSPAYGQS
jgi:hypothetical protein